MFAFVKTELSIGAARLDHQPRRCMVIEKRGDASVGDSLCGDLHVAGLGWRGANRVRPPNGLPIVVTFLGAAKTIQKFAQLDQCTGSPADDSALGAGCQTYKQCAAGVQVTLCTKQGGGHDVADTNVAWSVLKNYTLP